MPEPVFRFAEIAVPPVVAVINGINIAFHGLENIPDHGAALIAVNHTSYVDWYPVSLGAAKRRRRLRFMIKAEMQDVRGVNFGIKHLKLIPVDRRAGADAYAVAAQRLKEGEVVGTHPEATISRSFELKEFKTGTARLARAADVPIIPFIVWGAQRIWTKDQPKSLWRSKIPVIARAGAPVRPLDTVEQTNAALREAMTVLLQQAQEAYPHPAGASWVPRRLGGSAPTIAEALAMREAELAERADKRAAPAHERAGRARWRRGAMEAGRLDDTREW